MRVNIWNADEILYYATKVLCGDPLAGETRKNFKAGNLKMTTRNEKLVEFLDAIALSFRMDQHPEVWLDIIDSIYNVLLAQDVIADRTRSYTASSTQVLWVNLGYCLMGSLGRTFGFWCVDGVTGPEMPDGPQWFLPTKNVAGDRVVLPIEKVCIWWLGKAGVNEDKIWDPERARSFSRWKSGKTTPEIATIWGLFGPEQQDEFSENLPHLNLDLTEVRNQFLMARALEAAFVDLAKVITPDVDSRCADPKQNKALQLCELFRFSCQWTIDAGGGNPAEADARFRETVPEWLMSGPLNSIYPFQDGLLAPEQIADQFTAMFSNLSGKEGLWDIFSDPDTCLPALGVPQNANLSVQRQDMWNLIVDANSTWFGHNAGRECRFADALTKIHAHSLIGQFSPDVLRLEALDAISRGEFDIAQGRLDTALALCAVGSYGLLHADCAKLAFSISVALAAFDDKAERYFRIIARNLSTQEFNAFFENETDAVVPFEHALRQAAVSYSELFWAGLAHPYEGQVGFPRPLTNESEMFRAYFRIVFRENFEKEFDTWCKKYRIALRKRIHNVRGDTFFSMMMKFTHDFLTKIKADHTGNTDGKLSPTQLARNARSLLLKLAETSDTKTLNQADFKKQTPLMLAAVDGDLEMARILLDKRVDLDKQDTLGRTALHSAILGGHEDCFNAILNRPADPMIATGSGRTVLELAAELGRCDMFTKVFEKTRSLDRADEDLFQIYGRVSEICEDYKKQRTEFSRCGQKIGPKAGYVRLRDFLQLQI